MSVLTRCSFTVNTCGLTYPHNYVNLQCYFAVVNNYKNNYNILRILADILATAVLLPFSVN